MVLPIGAAGTEVDMRLPMEPVTFADLMPTLRTIADALVARAQVEAGRRGAAVSCRAGCAACCRQVVPVSPSEARTLARLVASLPAPRRAELRARFAAALARLDALGVLAQAARLAASGSGDGEAFERRYRAADVACPFLDGERCSIHAERPLACREHGVLSPPDLCDDPGDPSIETLPLEASIACALFEAERTREGVAWMPLVRSLAFAAGSPHGDEPRPAPELLWSLLDRIVSPA